MRYHLTSVRISIIKKFTTAGKDMKKREFLDTIGGNVNWCTHYGNSMVVLHKTKNRITIIIQQFHSWVYIWRKMKKKIQKSICITVFIAAPFIMAKVPKQAKYPSTDKRTKMWYICTMEYYSVIKGMKFYHFQQHQWT